MVRTPRLGSEVLLKYCRMRAKMCQRLVQRMLFWSCDVSVAKHTMQVANPCGADAHAVEKSRADAKWCEVKRTGDGQRRPPGPGRPCGSERQLLSFAGHRGSTDSMRFKRLEGNGTGCWVPCWRAVIEGGFLLF